MKNNNNGLIIAVGLISAALIGAFVAITLLYEGDKAIALAGLSALGLMAFSQLPGLKVSADNSAKITAVDHTLAVATEQQATALEGVNQKVDGHLSGMREEQRASNVMIATLIKQVASLEQDKAVKQSELAHQETSADKIIAAMPAVVAAALASTTPPAEIALPPIDEPRVGDKS